MHGHTTTAMHDNECTPPATRHRRDARVYDNATTAMHDNEYTPLPVILMPPPCALTGPGGCPAIEAYQRSEALHIRLDGL